MCVCFCVCALTPLGVSSRALNYAYVLIPLPIATTKGFPALPLPKWRDAQTHLLTRHAHTSVGILKQDSVGHELLPMQLHWTVTFLIKAQEIVFILIDSTASVTNRLPVQILRQAGINMGGGDEWLMLCPLLTTATEMPLKTAFNPPLQWSFSVASGSRLHPHWTAPSCE